MLEANEDVCGVLGRYYSRCVVLVILFNLSMVDANLHLFVGKLSPKLQVFFFLFLFSNLKVVVAVLHVLFFCALMMTRLIFSVPFENARNDSPELLRMRTLIPQHFAANIITFLTAMPLFFPSCDVN